jgi:iron(III) transport system substrate-binding protein
MILDSSGLAYYFWIFCKLLEAGNNHDSCRRSFVTCHKKFCLERIPMNQYRVFALILLITCALVFTASVCRGYAAVLNDVIAAARKEGNLNLHAPSVLRPQGAQELAAAFNKKYSLNIGVNYISSSNFTMDVAKVISQSALGIKPEWDMMLVSDNHHASLWRRKLHLPFDYRSLGVNSRSIEHDKGSVMIAHGVTLPAYNSKIVISKDIPTTWESLLDPKWKDGKLGISSSTHHFARLAVGTWGEKKTTEFVKGLARQRPFLGRLAELTTRLQLGEILVSATLVDNFVHGAKTTGAPIAFADRVEPIIMLGYNAGVLKGATHPSAAHLFAAFMITPEAQEIWEKFTGQTSLFVPGTNTSKFAAGKKTLLMRAEDAELIDGLTEEYSKLLGFGK